MKYCTFCGKQIMEGETCICARTTNVSHPAENRRAALMKKIIIIAIVATIALIAAIVIISAVSYANNEIDLSEYILIDEVSGLNGYGVVTYRLDEKALKQAMLGEETNIEITEENFESVLKEQWERYTDISNAISCIELSVNHEANLSNGDTVTVYACFRNAENFDFNFHFKDGSQTITVCGLPEPKTIDPFEYVDVVFEGLSGFGTAKVIVSSDDEAISSVFYVLSSDCNLKNGDTVTLSLNIDEAKFTELGYAYPTTTERTFSVSGLNEFFDISNGLPEDALTSFYQSALEMAKDAEKDSEDSGFSITAEAMVYDIYYLSAEDMTIPHYDGWHDISLVNGVAVITGHSWTWWGTSRTVWYVYIYPNLYIDQDGQILYDTNNVYYDYYFDYSNVEDVKIEVQKTYSDMAIIDLGLPVN